MRPTSAAVLKPKQGRNNNGLKTQPLEENPRKKVYGIPFDRFNEETKVVDPIGSRPMSMKSNASARLKSKGN